MDRTTYHFHGISVIVPFQLKARTELVAIDKGSLVPNTIPDKNEYTLIRLIANIALITREDYEKGETNYPVTSFDPPIELRVGYNCLDVIQSGCDIRNLKLAFWDGFRWVIISDDFHEYLILPPSTGLVAEAKIREWVGDPPLAWVT